MQLGVACELLERLVQGASGHLAKQVLSLPELPCASNNAGQVWSEVAGMGCIQAWCCLLSGEGLSMRFKPCKHMAVQQHAHFSHLIAVSHDAGTVMAG